MILALFAMLIEVPPPPPLPPPWIEEDRPIQMKGAEWMIGKSVDEIKREAKANVEFRNTFTPVDEDAGITDVQTAECNVVMYTKPDKAKAILVWKVHGFSKQWAGINGTDVECCSASLR